MKPCGRPVVLKLDEAEEAVRDSFKNRSSDSSAFQLKDMKDVYATKKRSYLRKILVCSKLNKLLQKVDTACQLPPNE